MVTDCLSRDPSFSVTATVRSAGLAQRGGARLRNVDWRVLDGDAVNLAEMLSVIDGQDWVINAIGITKPLIHDDLPEEVERAVRINSVLPHLIAQRAEATGARVLQIATDCVYSGATGDYAEDAAHDALDVYGKTKSLGEVHASSVHHLRCSIVGPEAKDHRSLLDWFLGQPTGAKLDGFTNHRWNGVTTLHFAKLCQGVITKQFEGLPHALHVLPRGEITKCDLLSSFARSYHRDDVSIIPTEASQVIDRTLRSEYAELNRDLWRWAGYATVPSIPDMVDELARYEYRFGECLAR